MENPQEKCSLMHSPTAGPSILNKNVTKSCWAMSPPDKMPIKDHLHDPSRGIVA